MARLHSFLVVVVVGVLATNVLGGSSMWEAKLQHHEHVIQHDPVPVDKAGYAIVDNQTGVNNILKRSQNKKRWLAELEGQGLRGKKWPDNTINYCWETRAGRSLMNKYLIEAFRLWDVAGLKNDKYKYNEIVGPGSECTGHKNRNDYLVIKYRPLPLGLYWFGGNAATVGKTDRPSMAISHGLGTKPLTAGLVAHELGHVWGIDHEMQHTGAWTRDYGPNPGTVFGAPGMWNCERLQGYDKAKAAVIADGLDPALLCNDRLFAEAYDFVASQYLPFREEGTTLSSHQLGALGVTDIDWESIMMYGSYLSAAPAWEAQPVLLRNDGLEIYDKWVPSQGDVYGVKALYGEEQIAGRPFPGLPNAPHDANAHKFRDMIRNKLGC